MTLEDLRYKQWSEHILDTDIAAKLGISRGYWNSIKNGKYPWTDKLEAKARQEFPALFLPNDVTVVSNSLTVVTQNTHQAHQDKLSKIRRLISRLRR